MRIALVCPHFPPDRCGVGDYTYRLAEELVREGHEVGVWTARRNPRRSKALIRTYGRSGSDQWGPLALAKITEDLRAWKPDGVMIQYIPYLYAGPLKGIAPHIPPWILALKARLGGAPVGVMAHELHYPAGIGSADRLLIGAPQFAVFQALALAADPLLFSIELFYEAYCKTYPALRPKFAWVPVGSNIPVASPEARHEAEKKLSLPEDGKLLLQFGTPHPTRLYSHAFEALAESKRRHSETRLIIVGTDPRRVSEELERSGHSALSPSVIAPGYLSENEVSACLSRADLVLSPFLDGVSTRRGSLMAALDHGKPVLGTRGYWTDPSARWDEFTRLSSSDDPNVFGQEAASLLGDTVERARLGAAAKRTYDTYFSWTRIAQSVARLLERRKGAA